MKSDKKEVVANIYLYLVTLIGLLMVAIPAVDIIRIGLQTWAFPLAAEDEFGFDRRPPEPFMLKSNSGSLAESTGEDVTLSEDDIEVFNDWKEDYMVWQEDQENKDFVGIRTQKSLVTDISTLVVGLALFLSHGSIIRKRKNS